MVQAPPRPKSTPFTLGPVASGSVGFNGSIMAVGLARQLAGDTAPDARGVRPDGVKPIVIDDVSAGYSFSSGIVPTAVGRRQLYYSEGGYAGWQPGRFTRPYKLNTQGDGTVAALRASDISGFRALNKRAHHCESSLGSSTGAVEYVAYGTLIDKKATSGALTNVDTTTDIITAIAELKGAGAMYLCVAGAGATTDIRGVLDPTAATPWTSSGVVLVALSAGDYINWMRYLPQFGANVLSGRIAGANGIWYFLDSETLPASPKAVVNTLTKDDVNANGPVETFGPYVPELAYSTERGLLVNSGNMAASDGSYATLAIPSSGGTATKGIYWHPKHLADLIPANLVVTGVVIKVEHKENAAGADIYPTFISAGALATLPAGSDLSPISTLVPPTENFAANYTLAANELTTADVTLTVGVSSQMHAYNLTAAIVRSASFAVLLAYTSEVTGGTVSLDYSDITISGRRPGFQLSSGGGVGSTGARGGYSPGMKDANTIIDIYPERDDPTGVTVPRKLRYLEFAYDSDGSRVTGAVTEVDTGMANVSYAWPSMGGCEVIGGPTAGQPGVQHKVVTSDNKIYDAGFEGLHGATGARVVWGISLGTASLLLVVHSNGTTCTDAMLWLFRPSKDTSGYHPFNLLQSKVATIALLPLDWAEGAYSHTYNQIAWIWPKTTNTNCSYTFVPPNIDADPLLVDTAEVKANGTLYTQLAHFDGGPAEAKRSLLTLRHLSPHVTATSGADGTVRVQIDTGGDLTVASPEVDVLFGGTTDLTASPPVVARFTDFNCWTGGAADAITDPGVDYANGLIVRLITNNATDTAKTPNALPLLLMTAQQELLSERLRITLSSEQSISVTLLLERLKTLQETSPVQRLSSGGFSTPRVVMMDDVKFEITQPTEGTQRPEWKDVKSAWIDLLAVPGAVT